MSDDHEPVELARQLDLIDHALDLARKAVRYAHFTEARGYLRGSLIMLDKLEAES